VDIVFKSSDSDLFGAHRKNLETFTDAFPSVESVTHDVNEIVELSETSDVLRLVILFTHHQKYPDLSQVPFQTLYEFAEAAEKYGIFSAMAVCHLALKYLSFCATSIGLTHGCRGAIETHPMEVLVHGSKHSYDDLRDAALPHACKITLETAKELCEGRHDIFMTWVR
jgi:hypothetical protein